MQLADRIDFPDFARAWAWKQGYKHPVEWYDDYFWKSDFGVRKAKYNYVPIRSVHGDYWANVEKQQQRWHPFRYYAGLCDTNFFKSVLQPSNPEMSCFK